jgi:rhodanese-related sulfurtransferase
MREGYTYVDVRSESEHADGHPEGAVNVPWLKDGLFDPVPNEAFLSTMESTFAKDAPLVIGCKGGVRSAKACAALVLVGFTNVVEQRAGWDGTRGPFGEIQEPGWKRVGLPSRLP